MDFKVKISILLITFFGIPQIMLIKGQTCTVPPVCNAATLKYRTYDGSCNNLITPLYGVAGTRYNLLFPICEPSNNPLPNTRNVSVKIFGFADNVDKQNSMVMVGFSQFLTHDISYGRDIKDKSTCCTAGGTLTGANGCTGIQGPIIVPVNDPFLSMFKCFPFAQTNFIDNTCKINSDPIDATTAKRNSVTSYFDLSQVYGVSSAQNADIRTFSSGKLKTEFRNNNEWPVSDPTNTGCLVNNYLPDQPAPGCYLFGDDRGNQNIQLSHMQITWVKFHNIYAAKLSTKHPEWNDEKCFQETRQLVIAIYQNIITYEYLKLVIGPANPLVIKLTKNDIFNIDYYNSNINPGVFSEHAAAAFRYLHSMIQDEAELCDGKSFPLNDCLFGIRCLEPDNYNNFTCGIAKQSTEAVDINFDPAIHNLMFVPTPNVIWDLLATDIQRGRDHKLCSYNTARKKCGLLSLSTWALVQLNFGPDITQNLQSLYKSPNDIDLMVGGSLEIHVPGTLFGPTFLCIVQEQFKNVIFGDRFYYKRPNAGFFTQGQLKTIKSMTLARVMCETSTIQQVQKRILEFPDVINPAVSCATIPTIDISQF